MDRRKFFKRIFKSAAGAVLLPPVFSGINVSKLGNFLERLVPKLKPKRAFDAWIFPVVKNMSSTDTINNILSVQPMNLPSSQIFYMDFVRKRPWWKFWSG